MATPSNPHLASSRPGKALAALLAGGILFVIGIGGSSALLGATGASGNHAALYQRATAA